MELSEVNESFATFAALKCITTTLCLFISFSTLYDFLTSLVSIKPPNQLLLSFSLRKNLKTLFNTKEDNNAITSIHGIRSISIFCIMTHHYVFYRAESPYISKKVLNEFVFTDVAQFVNKLTSTVDSFLVISGVLLTRACLRSLQRNNFSKTKIVLQRFLSITPCLAFVILFDDVLTRLAIKNEKDLLTLNYATKRCWKYWWMALLHIQNYFNPSNVCMSTSWSLDVDFQMFFIAPFLIYILFRYKEKFLPVICGLILISCLIGFQTVLDKKIMLIDLYYGNQHFDDPAHYLLYVPTHIRGMAILVGVILGYFIYKKENSGDPKQEESTFLQKVLTIVSLFILSTPITSFRQPLGRNLLLNAFYIGFGRFLWSAATAWIIYSCHVGLNTRINKFLSHRFWIPFGRMGLSVYFVHPVVQRFNIYQLKENVSFDILSLNFFTELLVILVGSIVFYLIIQEPINQISKFVIGKIFKAKNEKNK